MEKRYFVLKKGYLNIDAEFFYFSDHGNWKTCEIVEETENPKLTFTYVLEYLFETLMTVITIVIFMFLISGFLEFAFGMAGIFGVLFLLAIFHFFNRRYKIAQFKIPVDKIERLQVVSNQLTVKFANSKNQQIVHTIKLDDEAEVKDIKKYLSEHFNHKYATA
ncbi:hypothetical protein IMCC3317_14140 [Kordia antarctica]|uniref:Uncharacterized protein n=1 Tax=Kordia antarctica TaxID=1218801 RepID=A0A7L4ZHV2_9FLAO|nr:hypothetical protein [Kordia antarctica]QHI36061.1 hypothetical protein IMCC3317_14140 [Kordia antarctica]